LTCATGCYRGCVVMEDKIIKNCGFVIRVSTDKQARNPEGSLTNQLQRLQAHIEYKTNACGERWVETGRYILKGVSGKDSFRSIEFAQLLEDIKSGKVNTVICTALDRISRSVRDFLNFFEILTKYDVEFVCLKQNYDTTSSQGKLFITIMMALAEFERTQTSERNKEATLARAERGLWNGGHLLGYDLDPNRKGYPIVNEKEKALVQFAFKKYLECGSLMETTRALTSNGYRTKGYTSRRGKFRTPEKFGRSSIKQLLVNCAYIGLKEINKKKRLQDQSKLQEKERYRTVKAVWEPLIDEETFYKVQKLLKQNTMTKHNGTKIIKHTYILNGGLLWCGKCGGQMEGTCGTGRSGNKYFFYICKNKDCRFKLPADEIERIIIERIKYLSSDSGLMQKLIEHTNEKLMKELPQLKCRRTHLQKELAEVKAFADGIMNKWTAMATDDSSIFLKEKLAELGQRRKEIETGIASLEAMIKEIERESISQELVTLALSRFSDLFDKIKPYRQKDMVKLVLHKATLSPTKIQIALYGRQPDTGLLDLCKSDNEEIRCQTSIWLPVYDAFRNRDINLEIDLNIIKLLFEEANIVCA
jgi:site-specific DNA recombinase